MRYTVSQAVTLIVMDMVVMNMMIGALSQVNCRVTPSIQDAVVDFEARMVCGNPVGCGEFVVEFVSSTTFAERPAMKFHPQFWVRAAQP